MAFLGTIVVSASLFSSTFAQPIHWQPSVEGTTLVDLFVGIDIGLAVVIKVGLKVKQYVPVDIGFLPNPTTSHHF